MLNKCGNATFCTCAEKLGMYCSLALGVLGVLVALKEF